MELNSGVLDGILSLPTGGGAMSGLGERFQPDLFKGTGSYAVPLSLPAAQNGLRPSLTLRYSTGLANGPFGVGWDLGGVLDIRRRTDRGVPTYREDAFMIGGAELLVPVGHGRYRARTETRFLHIERRDEGWRIRSKEGRQWLLGLSSDSRCFDGQRVFSWHVEEERDVAGNTIRYHWERDEGSLYLTRVEWSIFALAFKYEDRGDAIQDGRAGFRRVVRRRCVAIERHCERTSPSLSSRYAFAYRAAPDTGLSLLAEIRHTGFEPSGAHEDAPALRFSYTDAALDDSRYTRIGAVGLPPSRLGGAITLVDFDGDGLPDVLDATRTRHRVWPNRGDGTFGPVRTLDDAPMGIAPGQPGVTFADLDADGAADLVRLDSRLSMMVQSSARGAWVERPRFFRQAIALRPQAADTRFVDLDGDGATDVLQGSRAGMVAFFHRDDGWSAPHSIPRTGDAGEFPDVDLASPEVHLADMTGDGLSDIVYVASGRVEYWQSLGHGRFASRVRMQQAPVLPYRYDARRLYLSDVNGDGITDIIYVDHDRVWIWVNQCGLAWSEPHVIRLPTPGGNASIHIVDLLGTGTRGVLWSDSPRADETTGWRYLQLGKGRAHLLERIDDEAGRETTIAYTTTAALRRHAAATKEPWTSYLPFVVQVVSEIVQHDRTTGETVRSALSYRNGQFDGIEREFDGFALVDLTTDAGPAIESAVQRTRFFTGAAETPEEARALSPEQRSRDRALVGTPLESVTYAVRENVRVPLTTSQMTWEAVVVDGDGSQSVCFPRLAKLTQIQHGDRERIEEVTYEHDRHGNIVRRSKHASFGDGATPPELATVQRSRYIANEQQWLVGLPARVETRDGQGRLLSDVQYFYDGPDFVGLPLEQATTGLVRRTTELALADWALPSGYAEAIDPSWGLRHEGEGWYRTSLAQRHDSKGNPAAIKDPLGFERTVTYDDDDLFPRRLIDGDAIVDVKFDARIAQPLELALPGQMAVRYVYSPLGHLVAQYDGTIENLALTRVFRVDLPVLVGDVRPARVTTVLPLEPGLKHEDILAATDVSTLDSVEVSCEIFDASARRVQRIRSTPRGQNGERFVAELRRTYAGTVVTADYPNRLVQSLAPVGIDENEPATRFQHDALARLAQVTTPDGKRHRVSYRADRVERRAPDVGDHDEPVIEKLDAEGRVTELAMPTGNGSTQRARYLLDPLGRTTAVIDDTNRLSLTYQYSVSGNPIRIAHADVGTRTYWHDARGTLRRRAEVGGAVLSFECDRHGRIETVQDITQSARPIELRRLVYDGARLVEARELDVVTRFEFDERGRPETFTLHVPGHAPATLKRERGLQGELRAVVYPDGTRLEYSSHTGAITGVIESIANDAYGRPTAVNYHGGAIASFAFDDTTLRLVESELRTTMGLARRQHLDYDEAGEIARVIDTLPDKVITRRYTYDRLRRLRRAEFSANPDAPAESVTQYDFTPTGDLLRGDANPDEDFAYSDPDRPGRLTSARLRGMPAASSMTYDDAGRVTSFASMSELTYDAWGRLVRGTLTDGSSVVFVYDHLGRRVAKTVTRGGSSKQVLYAEALYERREGDEVLRVFAGSRLVAIRVRTQGNVRDRVVLSDYQGSPIAIVEGTTVVHQQVYAPYGLMLRTGDNDDHHLGQAHDLELGLSQFGARYYSPALGRFLSADWWAFEHPDHTLRAPLALVAYGYAAGNPVRLRDPSGRWFGLDDLIVAGIGFVVGLVVGICVGIAQGKGVGDTLLLGLEAGLLGAAGAWLAYNTAGLALGLLGKIGLGVGAGWTTAIEVTAAVVGGANGVISGARQIYDWRSPSGYAAFLADSTWGLLGTMFGLLLHPFASGYRDDLSHRRNRHVYDGGPGFGSFAFTQGNVTTNWQGRAATNNLNDHEASHVLQNRIFGPVFTVTYVAWFVVGGIIGVIIGIFTSQGIRADFEDVGYYDNPWESWAYHEGGSAQGGTLAW